MLMAQHPRSLPCIERSTTSDGAIPFEIIYRILEGFETVHANSGHYTDQSLSKLTWYTQTRSPDRKI